MRRDLFWSETVGSNAELKVLIPGMTTSALRRWRDTGRIRKRSPAGRSSLWLAGEVAELFAVAGMMAMRLSHVEACAAWDAGGAKILARRTEHGPATDLLPMSLIVFRGADGRITVALADDDGTPEASAAAAMKAAAQIYTTVRLDALLDVLAASIAEQLPECDAVMGPPALRAMRAPAAPRLVR